MAIDFNSLTHSGLCVLRLEAIKGSGIPILQAPPPSWTSRYDANLFRLRVLSSSFRVQEFNLELLT